MFPNWFYEVSITLILKADKNITGKGKYRPISLKHIHAKKKKKKHSKIITSQLQKHIKIMMFYDQVECIPGMEG